MNTLILLDHWRGERRQRTQISLGALTTESGAELTTEAAETPLGGEGARQTWLPSLNELKVHLRLETSDSEEDDRLTTIRDAAAQTLAQEIGQDLEATDYVGSARTCGRDDWEAIQIDRSNVIAVAGIALDGATLGFTARNLRGLSVLVPADGERYFSTTGGQDQLVEVEYTRGFSAASPQAPILKQAVLALAHAMYFQPGAETDADVRRSSAYRAAVALLRDRRNLMKWSAQ